MKKDTISVKAIEQDDLDFTECMELYLNYSTAGLMYLANEMRKEKVKHGKVTWIIDRNVNITNICISRCKFCNFHRKPGDQGTYITTIDEYKQKINELLRLGGNQLLLQGGLNPDLGLNYYCDLFQTLKKIYPDLKLHALGPPEIVFLAKKEKKPYRYILEKLVKAGLDSLPGAGAEILCDVVRKAVSPAKATSQEWLDVMYEAHQMGMITSATMMFGHAETREDRINHLLKIRDLQKKKPLNAPGFVAFIPWPFQDENTILKTRKGIINKVTAEEYIRTIAISRIILNNINNIQASWLTVGKETAQVCLHAGANDFGSIMIEENVVSSAGANYKFNSDGMQKAILEAGFEPRLRDQGYNFVNLPEHLKTK